MYKEWSEFSKQLFRKMFKKIDQRPELIVELLFSKIRATIHYLEFGQEKQTIAATRAPAELEVRPAPGRDDVEQIGIVVTVLLKDGQTELVQWVKNMLAKAHDERHAWEAEAEARKAAALESPEGSTESLIIGEPPSMTVRPTSEDIKTAMFKNGRLRLLMSLVAFERLGDEDVLGATWTVPANITADNLAKSKAAIEQYEQTPWQAADANEDAEDMIRRRKKAKTSYHDDEDAPRDAFIDNSEGEEEFLFPDNPRRKSKDILKELKARRKRKRGSDDEGDEVDEEAAARRRAARDAAARDRRLKIKSEAYIRDSDDESDTEKDRVFFEQEEELRKKTADDHVRKQRAFVSEQSGKTKGKGKKAAISQTQEPQHDSDDDVLMGGVNDDLNETGSSQPRRKSDTEDESAEEDTPFSSPSSATANLRHGGSDKLALREMAQPRTVSDNVSAKAVVSATTNDSDGDEDVVPTTRRRQIRGGFLVDSDDEDE
jgi:replication fork protection complex subunit Tof1/Swi1